MKASRDLLANRHVYRGYLSSRLPSEDLMPDMMRWKPSSLLHALMASSLVTRPAWYSSTACWSNVFMSLSTSRSENPFQLLGRRGKIEWKVWKGKTRGGSPLTGCVMKRQPQNGRQENTYQKETSPERVRRGLKNNSVYCEGLLASTSHPLRGPLPE